MRTCLSAAATFALLCSAALGQSIQTLPDIDRLAAEPGAEVVRDTNGAVAAVTLQRNGVSIRSTRQSGQVRTVGVDQSGHGAVLCLWRIYIQARSSLDLCLPNQYPELRREMDGTIGRINNFIAANSLVPISAQAVAAAIAAQDAAIKTQLQAMGPGGLAKVCAAPAATQLATALAHQSQAERQRFVADLVSVPRPPVMNPCM